MTTHPSSVAAPGDLLRTRQAVLAEDLVARQFAAHPGLLERYGPAGRAKCLLRLDLEPTDLAQLVRRNVTLNRVLAARKDIAVEMELPDAIPPMPLDPGKLEQVVNNLIGNAVKFSPDGSTVDVTLASAGDEVVLGVRDHGPGIPADQVDRLFRPFERLRRSGENTEPGTGLGLAIVKRIVDAHGGRIWVETEHEKGADIRVALPAAR